jgi:iron complex transport system ATP-binding protein
MLEAKDISFRIGERYLLHPASIQFQRGKFHVIMGANGAGKSTLLKLLAGDQAPSSGTILLNGAALKTISKKVLATKRAVLSQHYNITFPISSEEIVMMGRYPHFSNNPTLRDRAIVKEAMELLQVDEMKERDYNTLSGGEAQKVQMSRVFAQIWEKKTEPYLFLDEPVSHLDIKFQHQLLKAAKEWCRENTTVVAILHDINLAIAFADRILFMKQGKITHDIGRLGDITTAVIKEVFDVEASILYPEQHRPVIIFNQ